MYCGVPSAPKSMKWSSAHLWIIMSLGWQRHLFIKLWNKFTPREGNLCVGCLHRDCVGKWAMGRIVHLCTMLVGALTAAQLAHTYFCTNCSRLLTLWLSFGSSLLELKQLCMCVSPPLNVTKCVWCCCQPPQEMNKLRMAAVAWRQVSKFISFP